MQNTHGLSRGRKVHPVLKSYYDMKERCYNPKKERYPRYGGRGIIVEEPWKSSVESFLHDMLPSWGEGMTIDRIDPDGPYCRANCRWASKHDQLHNKTNNNKVTFNGKTQTCTLWARELGIPVQTVLARAEKNWPAEAILFLGNLRKKKDASSFLEKYPHLSSWLEEIERRPERSKKSGRYSSV